jgi:hypothetical protein
MDDRKELINEVRAARLHVLSRKLDALAGRFPEFDSPEPIQLSDEDIIREALLRELRWQEQAIAQMDKGQG